MEPVSRWISSSSTGLQMSRTKLANKQCCRSGMFIPDPDFFSSWIPNNESNNNKDAEGKNKLVVLPFFRKIVNYLIVEQVESREKDLSQN
jgi:hypothetical protein